MHRFGKGVRMIGASTGRQRVHRIFQRIDGCDQLCVGNRGICKTDNTDTAAGTNLPILRAARRLFDDPDKRFSAGLHVGQRRSGHTSRSIQHQHDVSGIGNNIRRSRQGQRHPQRAGAVNPIHIDDFIGIRYTQLYYLFPGGISPALHTMLPAPF